MDFSKIRTLVLYARLTDKLSYYDDWRDAFLCSEHFAVTSKDILEPGNMPNVSNTIKEYDLIVLLHSTNGPGTRYLKPYKDILKRRKAKLLTLVGNEVNLPNVSMREKIDFIRDIEANFIGTQLPLEAGEWLFAECKKAKVVALPHALNPDVFKSVIPQESRPIDIGFRSNRYLSHLGDNDREAIAGYFLKNKFKPPLKLDISTDSRFNREGWANFLNRCKGTVSNEAGTYYLERDDRTVQMIQEYIEGKAREKGLYVISDPTQLPAWWRVLPPRFKTFARKVLKPFGIINKSDERRLICFDEIFKIFYGDYQKPNFYSKAISSRHFDAIGTKTCQIMFEGKFNGILKADEHYISLKRDFSNIEDAMKRFGDLSYRKMMVERTYDYIMSTHTYKHRLKTIASLAGAHL